MDKNFNALSPINEYELFRDNLKTLLENVNKIVTLIKPMLSNGLNISCKTSKTISDFICTFDNKLDSIYTSLSNNNLNFSSENIKHLNKLINSNMLKTEKKKNKPNVAIQQGGSFINNYNYNFIIDPVNNKKISIYKKRGIQIIHNYLDKN
jgi:hypothetical protein